MVNNICVFFVVFAVTGLVRSKSTHLCETGTTFWNMNEVRCQLCRTCSREQIVLRPCQMFHDVVCQSIHEFSQFNQSYYSQKQDQYVSILKKVTSLNYNQ